jgi:GT2 family glycosyltransferase
MSGARVTIVVVPRDRYGVTERALENLYEHTPQPFELVYVDVASPRRTRRYLEAQARERGFRLLRFDDHLAPNQARNAGVGLVDTEYTVFVDNDVIVTPGWLPPLVERADETGAWVVGPLYLIGELELGWIHAAGGELHFDGSGDDRMMRSDHLLQGQVLSELPELPPARACDFAEFHCMLVRTDTFDRIGPLDEALLSTREHEDLALAVRAQGGTVWTEPRSVVTYLPPPRHPKLVGAFGPPLRVSDVPYFARRWSERWNEDSVEHFRVKHGLGTFFRKRVRNGNEQRIAFLMPVRRVVRPVLGERIDDKLTRGLHRYERRLNRRLVR